MKLFVNYDFKGGVKGGTVSWGFRRNLSLVLSRKQTNDLFGVISELLRSYEKQFYVFKGIRFKRKNPFIGGV